MCPAPSSATARTGTLSPVNPAGVRTLNAAVRAVDAGAPLHLLVPNPDWFYPRPDGVGLTSGASTPDNLVGAAVARLDTFCRSTVC